MADYAYTRHARLRMSQRGASESEVVDAMRTGAECPARPPRLCRETVFRDGYQHRGRHYPHKLVRVFYVEEGAAIIVLTVIIRYGEWEE